MPTQDPTAQITRRPRRSSDEVRRLILQAASELFAENGFAATTTREIAQRAQVREATMFRIYESKERLYEQAVLGPFSRYLDDFAERWMAIEAPGGHPSEVLAQFVRELHDLVVDNRALVAAMDLNDVVGDHAQASLAHLERVGRTIAERYGLDFDVPVAVRIATVSVLATTLLEETLFPPAMRGERLRAELTRMLIGATLYRDS